MSRKGNVKKRQCQKKQCQEKAMSGKNNQYKGIEKMPFAF